MIDDIYADEIADRFGDYDEQTDCYSFNRTGAYSVRSVVAEVENRIAWRIRQYMEHNNLTLYGSAWGSLSEHDKGEATALSTVLDWLDHN